MRDTPLQVELVSPERVLHRGAASSVRAEAFDGSVGILPGHAPMMALLGTGTVALGGAGGGAGTAYAIRGGFLQVVGGKVTLLVTQALAAGDVDAAKNRAELEKVVGDLRHPKDDAEYERLLDERRWLEAVDRIAGGK